MSRLNMSLPITALGRGTLYRAIIDLPDELVDKDRPLQSSLVFFEVHKDGSPGEQLAGLLSQAWGVDGRDWLDAGFIYNIYSARELYDNASGAPETGELRLFEVGGGPDGVVYETTDLVFLVSPKVQSRLMSLVATINSRQAAPALVWGDPLTCEPPDTGLFLVFGDRGSALTDLAVGFYADGTFHIGTSMAGDPLPEDQVVHYYAPVVWPAGVDENGILVGKPTVPEFLIDGQWFRAEAYTDGVLINPLLPPAFDNTANDERPDSHKKWWGRPFIETESVDSLDRYHAERTDQFAGEGLEMWRTKGRNEWLKAFPGGTRYMVRCLDGGAWDRSTMWGAFGQLDEALACAKNGPDWRKA